MNWFVIILFLVAVASAAAREPNCPIQCRPTCKVPNPVNCGNVSPLCTFCGRGKVWNEETSTCVTPIQCPYGKGCKGDKNAYVRADPPACPAVCKSPNEVSCDKPKKDVGCLCNPGHVLKEVGGKCVKSNDCPGGNPCGRNSTFAYCKLECEALYCPTESRQYRNEDACEALIGCPAGCSCNIGYLWKSKTDKTCVLAEDCPKVTCPDKNEVWDGCPSACYTDHCVDVSRSKNPCNRTKNCYPQCQCKEGYAREHKVCIEANKCQKTGDEIQFTDDPDEEEHPYDYVH